MIMGRVDSYIFDGKPLSQLGVRHQAFLSPHSPQRIAVYLGGMNGMTLEERVAEKAPSQKESTLRTIIFRGFVELWGA